MAPTMTLQTECVAFRGDNLITVRKDDKVFVAVKPISDALGVDWKWQLKKFTIEKPSTVDIAGGTKASTAYIDGGAGASKGIERRWGSTLIPVQVGGFLRETLCLPLEKMNGWLFSINPEKVKPEVRAKVVAYQEECFAVLHSYWHKGFAVRGAQGAECAMPGAAVEERGLNDAERRQINGVIYARIQSALRDVKFDSANMWRGMLRDKFGTDRLQSLPASRLPEVLGFIDAMNPLEVIRAALVPGYVPVLAKSAGFGLARWVQAEGGVA